MTGLTAPAWALAASVLGSVVSAGPSSVSIPLDRERWVISLDNFKLDPVDRDLHNGEVVELLGRRCMRVSKGLFHARGVDFRDGIIDADMAFAANGIFFGLAFHVESADQYEVIFFRPGASGTTQAIQYTPGCAAPTSGSSTRAPDTSRRRTSLGKSGFMCGSRSAGAWPGSTSTGPPSLR